jgi:colanic acid/amylovoran biosynthesis protein
MHESDSTLVVGLLWHSLSSDNLGVGALTLSQIALARQAASKVGLQAAFVVVGTKGANQTNTLPSGVRQQSEFALRAFKAMDFSALTVFRQCDLVLDIGEGDSFADIYGVKRLSMQVMAKWLAKLSGAQLILSPQTIGPFNSPIGRVLGKLGLAAASRVYVRDGLSRAYCKSLLPRGEVHEAIDVAFALPFNKPAALPGQPVRVGLNVSGLLFNGGYDGRNQFGLALDYRAFVEDCCEYFTGLPGVETYLVPHVISEAHQVEDDWRASLSLIQRFPRLKLAPRFDSAVDAKSFISGMDYFSGARMHACIAAFSSGVPVIPVAYSRKFNGLFSALGYGRIIDALVETRAAALASVTEGFAERASLRQHVAEGNNEAQRRLVAYVDDLATLMRQRARVSDLRTGGAR